MRTLLTATEQEAESQLRRDEILWFPTQYGSQIHSLTVSDEDLMPKEDRLRHRRRFRIQRRLEKVEGE